MSGRALAVGTLPAGVDRERFAARLVAAVRPEFAAEVIVPAPGDVVLGTPACAVPDCGRASSRQGWCQAHFRRWDKVGRPERQAWAAAADPQTWGHRRLAGCRAPGCRFSQHRDRLCYRHSQDWRRDGQSEIHAWLAALPPTDHRDHAECAVDGCDLLAELGEPGLCRSHRSGGAARDGPAWPSSCSAAPSTANRASICGG